MTRNRRTARDAGTRFETTIANALGVERRTRNGANDRGDIAGVHDAFGHRLVIECKDHGGQIRAGTWLTEAARERANDGAAAALVIAKRRGTTDPLAQIVICTVADLLTLIGSTTSGTPESPPTGQTGAITGRPSVNAQL